MCGNSTQAFQLPRAHALDSDTSMVYRANPFTNTWEYWDRGWIPSASYDATPINATGHKILRRGGVKIVAYEKTWAEPVYADLA